MSNKKQSSVEWLAEKFTEDSHNQWEIKVLVNRALQMHKEEIKDAHFDGQCDKTEGYLIVIAEHYYNEIFGGEKQC